MMVEPSHSYLVANFSAMGYYTSVPMLTQGILTSEGVQGHLTSVNASRDLTTSINTSVKVAKWLSLQDRWVCLQCVLP